MFFFSMSRRKNVTSTKRCMFGLVKMD
jgi:hypothetical protein